MTIRNLSIQNKITYSFTALVLLMAGTVVISYVMVQQVERKVHLVEFIEDFKKLSNDLRRYEKNYFLYLNDKDYADNLDHLTTMQDTLDRNISIFRYFLPSVNVETIDTLLLEYKKNMKRLHLSNKKGVFEKGTSQKQLQMEIRNAGHELTEITETITRRERETIKKLLKTSRSVLLTSTGALVVLSFVLAMLLGKKIVSSLKNLETYTDKIANGELVDPPERNVEDEIQSLFQAFTRMNNELRLRQRQMVQTEKLASLGTLLAGVAHELNNPLSNISSSAQILTEEIMEQGNDFHIKLVDQIEEQTDKARDIVRTLLEFSRTKEFIREQFYLLGLIKGTIQLLRAEIPTDVAIDIDIPKDLQVFADKQRLQQVFLNLIKNAVDALDGTGTIWISAKEYLSRGSHKEVEILVSDNGPGIEPHAIKKIFDPFYTTKDVGKGSGLGLFIVHDIIESHGGTITLDSRVNEGTSFVIWLPGEPKNDGHDGKDSDN
ncbi:MAG: ATP-binding protein [Desulfobulbaceae bacterium]|nr:ATP-binding protein [Desulfobulbaceae bacterium]